MSKNKKEAKERDINSFKPEDQKDIKAVQSVLSGDKDAYVRILERYRPHLVRRFFLKVKDRTIAEDLASDVLVKVYQKLAMYKRTHTFNSWFYMIADRFLIDWSRKAEWKFKQSTSSYDNMMTTTEGAQTSFAETMLDPDASSDSRILEEERKEALREALASLDDTGRKLIAMFYGKEMSYDEMADEMEMNANTMRVHLMRAKRKVAEYISRMFPEFEMKAYASKSLQKVDTEKVNVDGEDYLTYITH